MQELITFDLVGIKTASCVLLFCLSRESFAVDTSVLSLSSPSLPLTNLSPLTQTATFTASPFPSPGHPPQQRGTKPSSTSTPSSRRSSNTVSTVCWLSMGGAVQSVRRME